MQRHISFDIHQRLRCNQIDLWYPRRQWFQLNSFHREQFPGHSVDMLFISTVDPVAPCARLAVQVVPVGEGSTGQKIVLNKVEGPLHPSQSGWRRRFSWQRTESEAIGECGHFGYGNHVTACAAQHYDVGVVDHDPTCRATEEAMRVGQEYFAIEALKRRIELEKRHT